MFIVFEGLDGAGKSTIISALSIYLQQKNLECITCCNPPSDIKGRLGLSLSEEYKTVLTLSSIIHTYDTIIKPALDNNIIVICDRYLASNYAYAVETNGISSMEMLRTHATFTDNHIKPITVYLDISPEESLKRRIDFYSLAKLKQIYKNYNTYPFDNTMISIDATQPLAEVYELVRIFVDKHLCN